MSLNRIGITSALFTLIANSYPFVTADPRLHLPDDIATCGQPAFFLVKPVEHTSQEKTFGLPIYTIKYFAYIAVRSDGSPSDSGASAENQTDTIITAVENALAPRPGELQSLGGLVYHCWVDGDVLIDTPVFFQQAAIWIPITAITGI